MRVREPPRDRRPGEVDDGVDARQQVGRAGRRDPIAVRPAICAACRTSRITRCPPVLRNADKRRADQAGRAGDRHDQRPQAGVAVRRDGRPGRRRAGGAGRRTSDAAPRRAPAHRCGRTPRVPDPATSPNSCVWRPSSDDPRRPRPRAARGEHVDEPVRRVESGGVVLRDPAQPARQTEHGASVGQRVGLGHHLHRLPRRHQSPHRARPRVPREYFGQGMVDDALVLDAHM